MTENKPKPKVEVDPVRTAWPKVKNPEPGTLAAAGSGQSSKVSPVQSKSKPSAPPTPSPSSTKIPAPSPSRAPNTPQPGPSAVSALTSALSPAAAAVVMPEGKQVGHLFSFI